MRKVEEYPAAIRGEKLYVEYDEETASWCIFGSDSGHAYTCVSSKEEAEADLARFPEDRRA
jgi:hypothetical protein